MRLASGKFKHLIEAKGLLSSESLPEFQKMTSVDDATLDFPLIMRSALKNEAQDTKLLSGKSLSIGNIDSRQKLIESWERIRAQPDVEEVILQKEIPWTTHFTLICEESFFFAEARSRENKAEFFYWTPMAEARHEGFVPAVRSLLEKLDPLLKTKNLWLLELGSFEGKVFLFQIHPISPAHLKNIFSNDLALKVVSARQRFQNSRGLWKLLKTEWQARKFRKNKHHLVHHPSSVFLNWEYIFHYFRLYCMLNGKNPTAEVFAKFLSASYKNNWISELFQHHLKISNDLRKDEIFDPISATFPHAGMIFIGRGELLGELGKDILLSPVLDLDLIYESSGIKAILTKEVSLLGHGVLAAAERRIFLVVGIPESIYCELRNGDKIYLDFDERHLEVR